jgi:hypothetical protein
MQRREVLKLVACSAGSLALEPAGMASPRPVPIIDAHIHLLGTRHKPTSSKSKDASRE